MASQRDENDERDSDAEVEEKLALREEDGAVGGGEELATSGETEVVGVDEHIPGDFGARKYVHVAFFAAGLLAAFISGKVLLGIWDALADWAVAVEAVPALQRLSEEERSTYTTSLGVIVGVALVISFYRREQVRTWADEVAAELSRVTWPTRETVQTGTLVVVVASVVATIYVGLLDRFWGFITNLVYGV